MIADEHFHAVNRALHPWMYPHRLPADDNYESRYQDAFAFARAHELRDPHKFAVLAMVKEALR